MDKSRPGEFERDFVNKVDWNNEESIRYLSAINCLQNYILGKDGGHEETEIPNPAAPTRTSRTRRFLTFSRTIEEITLWNHENPSWTGDVRQRPETVGFEGPGIRCAVQVPIKDG